MAVNKNKFNLSAYLEGAPTDTGALTFIPLITLLLAALGINAG